MKFDEHGRPLIRTASTAGRDLTVDQEDTAPETDPHAGQDFSTDQDDPNLDPASSKYNVTVPSFTDVGVRYVINTWYMTCSCREWDKRRKGFDRDDPRRLCKHLVRVMFGKYLSDPFFPLLKICYERGWGVPVEKEPRVLSPTTAVLLPSPNDVGQWCAIALDGEIYEYSFAHDKWSHGKKPDKESMTELFTALTGISSDGKITTVRRGTDPEDLQDMPDVSKKLISKGGWVAFGEIEGVKVRACINPEASRQRFVLNDLSASYNVKKDDWRGPSSLNHLRPAAVAWIQAEYEESRKK